MTMNLKILTEKVLHGGLITGEEARFLYEQPIRELCNCADKIRNRFCSDHFDICTIINAKSGNCSEDCRFCAQSARNKASAEAYSLLPEEAILKQAEAAKEQGIMRYSIVTSGKRLPDNEVERMCGTIRKIRNRTGLSVCVSFGLLKKEAFRKLKEAGVSRIHNNLETSRRNFGNICTTHSYDDKLESIKAAQAEGLSVCSGGIMGLGETVEDRIDMALCLRRLGIKSVPVNILNPIPGTPFENNMKLSEQDILRTVAVYRFLLPDAFIRLAGGRGLLSDKGRSCFISGANAAISGDMLTTAGITAEADMELLNELGYEVRF